MKQGFQKEIIPDTTEKICLLIEKPPELWKNSVRLSALSDCINCFYKRYYLPTNHSAMGLQSFILF